MKDLLKDIEKNRYIYTNVDKKVEKQIEHLLYKQGFLTVKDFSEIMGIHVKTILSKQKIKNKRGKKNGL